MMTEVFGIEFTYLVNVNGMYKKENSHSCSGYSDIDGGGFRHYDTGIPGARTVGICAEENKSHIVEEKVR